MSDFSKHDPFGILPSDDKNPYGPNAKPKDSGTKSLPSPLGLENDDETPSSPEPKKSQEELQSEWIELINSIETIAVEQINFNIPEFEKDDEILTQILSTAISQIQISIDVREG